MQAQKKWCMPGNDGLDTHRKAIDTIDSIGEFPHCKLHDCKIVTEFPSGCPYRQRNPAEKLAEYKNLGWRQLSEDRGRSGLTLLAIQDHCSECISRIGNHPHVVWLRNQRSLRRGA